ncbi:type 3 dihydrofolate reductase [Paraglaciecola polaris]|uniref:Dihydrofolate reductase n=1 Tax=Paraglaciecola polaris LMG 21857 TaxID=1129793 RepID=K6YQU0_9ALTE|nr:type 3 dihydrofolate reductase [Paraglaciecola polaris]GAC35104.1 dihydrofolate reductase [Paraglaciecola polaris LMG 21857]
MAKIALIAAMANKRVIGLNNQMPWHMPADLQHFKRVTLGKPIIMGRKTYESIGRALPGRLNIVITHDQAYQLADATVVNSCDNAIATATSHLSQQGLSDEEQEIMVIGGGTVYQHFLPYSHCLYLTLIALDTPGDTYFPDYSDDGWREVNVESHEPDHKNPHFYQFVTLER